ncbi:uncharacterized protein [Aristolochia californica]|uniref:uncharacterized protein isoform X2 n=1 Tax=Aristolochia californica TaxID=171875 RepID=UPI0035DC2789
MELSLLVQRPLCFRGNLRPGSYLKIKPSSLGFSVGRWEATSLGLFPSPKIYSGQLNLRSHGYMIPRAADMAAGKSDEPQKLNLEGAMDTIRSFWHSLPLPVKRFPWDTAFGHFVEIIFELISSVIKYLCIPLLAVSSLSELSYCAHEQKLILTPIPLLGGLAIAGILNNAALDVAPDLKVGGFPWHLLLMAFFFTLLKLPGPYYPYWARIFVPHFANGGLWRTVWFTFLWYRQSQESSKLDLGTSINDNESKE